MAPLAATTDTSATNNTRPPTFVIGISGASGSGKTVLAVVLADIFQTAMTKESAGIPNITIISQDDYLRPEHELPRTSFRLREVDQHLVINRSHDDDVVITHDRESLPATDWIHMHKDILAVISGGTPSRPANKLHTSHRAEMANYQQNLAAHISVGEHQYLCREIWETVNTGIELNMDDDYEGTMFKDDGDQGDLLNAHIVIVEGCHLYSRDKPQLPSNLTMDPDQLAVRQRLPPRLHGSAKASHEAIASLLDVRLYLNVTPEDSFMRRFTREPYMDPPLGSRLPGQMWKTRGYYHDVVRRSFYGYDTLPVSMLHQLLQGNMMTNGAVHLILQKMAQNEAELRTWFCKVVQYEQDAMRYSRST